MEPTKPIEKIAAEDYADFIRRLEAGEVAEPSPEVIAQAKKDYKEFCEKNPIPQN